MVKVTGSFLPMADAIKFMSKKVVRVGVVAPQDSGEAVKANANEYGARIKVTQKMRGYLAKVLGVHLKKTTTYIIIPERSFLRSTFDDEVKLKRMFKSVDAVVDENFNAKTALNILGLMAAKEVRATITAGVEPGNSDLTKKIKGSSKPLMNKGRLRQGIKHAVVSA